jgi:DNA polymerase III subunit gamma/tau
VNYQSLYRRYRPQRFGDVAGQEHVSETLRNAVVTNRVAHAYLFSGPRGCGKTTNARILAKALNCTNLQNGEPCCECESCLLVASGASMDVIELDAASNNGVDAMRELVSRASLGTAGRRKVYIVDEVHMLTAAASNALLKTLEEPPDHVVFVLATTDPQKVLATIRSRTQAFEFRLFSYPALLELVRKVALDAELNLDDETLQAVTRRGNGSARDALSALDQAAAAGGIDDSFDVSELAVAVGALDPAAVLVGVDRAMELGRDPRQLARDLIETFRGVFLIHMGRSGSASPALVSTIGPAAATRSLETIGEALVAMRDAVEPRIVLEVALLRLVRPDLDKNVAAIQQRVEALEAKLALVPVTTGGPAYVPYVAPAVPVVESAPVAVPEPARAAVVAEPAPAEPVPAEPVAAQAVAERAPVASPEPPTRTLPTLRPTSGTTEAAAPRKGGAADAARAQLASNRMANGETKPRMSAGPGVAPTAPTQPAPAPAAAPTPVATAATSPAAPVSLGEATVESLNTNLETILELVGPRARALFRVGRFDAVANGNAIMSVPNAAHLERAREVEAELGAALAGQFNGLTLTLRSDEDAPLSEAPAPPVAVPSAPVESAPVEYSDEADIDLHELIDAPDNSGNTALDQLTAIFPGAEVVE